MRLATLRRAVGDQRKAGKLSEAHGACRLGEVGAGRSDEHVRVGEHVDPLDRRLERIGDERKVDLAAHEQPTQLPVLRLDEPHLDRGPPLDVETHDRGNHPHADALERRDAKRPGLSLGECMQIGLGSAHRRNGSRSVPEQALARFGRRHRAPPAGAFEELQFRGALEHRDLLADRRLRVPEPAGRGCERAGLDDRLERGEVAKLDAEQPISGIVRRLQELAFYLSVGCPDPDETWPGLCTGNSFAIGSSSRCRPLP